MLWAIVRGTTWNITLLQEFTTLLDDGEGQMIQKLPGTMLTDLTSLTSEQIESASSKWASTEELSWQPEEAREVIVDLMRLAKQAVKDGKSVYLWNCV